VLLLIAAVVAVSGEEEPFIYKPPHQLKPDPQPVVDLASERTAADTQWKPTMMNRPVPASLKDPKPPKKHVHDIDSPKLVIANLADPKPQVKRPRGERQTVRAHIRVPEQRTPPPVEVRHFVRAHIVAPRTAVKPTNVEAEKVIANAHINWSNPTKRGVRPEPERVVANAHITQPTRRIRKPVQRTRDIVTADRDISREFDRQRRVPRQPKKQREFVSADIALPR